MSSIGGIAGVADAAALEAAGVTTSTNDAMGQATFLNLLTTQMQHQDPLSPMSNEEMVAQLATFSQLEQLTAIKEATQANTLSITNLTNTTMASLVGKHVVAIGDTFPYDGADGATELNYESSGAGVATLNVYDEDGSVVYSEKVKVEKGESVVEWDGKDLSGQPVPEGEYRFELTDGEDSAGNDLQIDEYIVGLIDSMDYSSGTPLPTVNGITVGLGDLVRLTVADGEEA